MKGTPISKVVPEIDVNIFLNAHNLELNFNIIMQFVPFSNTYMSAIVYEIQLINDIYQKNSEFNN